MLITVLIFSAASGQIVRGYSCLCPESTLADSKVDTVFKLCNNREIALCGSRSNDSTPPIFSEFVLSECGSDSIIDFWGATENCRLDIDNDTLQVHTLVNLPTGKNFNFQMTVWTTEMIFYYKDRLLRQLLVNRQIHKYNNDEINILLRNYETTEKKISDTTMELTCKLLIAALSGSKTAEKYFRESKTIYGALDGGYSEEYSDMVAMLDLWQSNK